MTSHSPVTSPHERTEIVDRRVLPVSVYRGQATLGSNFRLRPPAQCICLHSRRDQNDGATPQFSVRKPLKHVVLLTLQFKLTAVHTVAKPEIAVLSWSDGLVIDATYAARCSMSAGGPIGRPRVSGTGQYPPRRILVQACFLPCPSTDSGRGKYDFPLRADLGEQNKRCIDEEPRAGRHSNLALRRSYRRPSLVNINSVWTAGR
jgi:hypothetical protein